MDLTDRILTKCTAGPPPPLHRIQLSILNNASSGTSTVCTNATSMMNEDTERCSTTSLKKLYSISLESAAANLDLYTDTLHYLPITFVIDILEKVYEMKLPKNLQHQLSNLKLLEKILKHSSNWKIVHKCLHLILENETRFGLYLASLKVKEYEFIKQEVALGCFKESEIIQFIYSVMRLGSFFAESAMYECAKVVYDCADFLDMNSNLNKKHLEIAFEVTVRISHVLTLDCQFDEADKAIVNANGLLAYFESYKPNCAMFYTTCSIYMYSLSQYDKSYTLAMQAVEELRQNLPPKVIVDTLRQACKACIIKRVFDPAHTYIKEAVKLAKHFFGTDHPKYADCLSDYGFLLLSVDSVGHAVKFYKLALKIHQDLFGERNVHTAITHEDLAYAMYVNEYNRGDFKEARLHAEYAQLYLSELLPRNHLLLSSSKRVQALILEEIAIDSDGNNIQQNLLTWAEKLHLDSLQITSNKFGERNLQTAKHLGNLGRLYQSMKKYQEAEKNHLKAIEIKEKLLGPEDYEVSLSIGHLASLYNYDMEKYDLAERLYLRSISIGCKLFGRWYSGLEYDYRGLIHLYEKNQRDEEKSRYEIHLSDWSYERERKCSRLLKEESIDFESDVCLRTSLEYVKASAAHQMANPPPAKR